MGSLEGAYSAALERAMVGVEWGGESISVGWRWRSPWGFGSPSLIVSCEL